MKVFPDDLVLKVDDVRTLFPGVNVTVRRLSDKYRDLYGTRTCTLTDGTRSAVGRVQQTHECRFHQLADHWLLKEHDACDRSKRGLFWSMRKFYPGFTAQDYVVVIWFTCEEVTGV